jgi:HAD superfamily hydrolase (TIGR01509 family)
MADATRPGVIFDVDGTLLDTPYLHAVAWARAFRDGGYDVPMAAIHRAIGIASNELVEFVLGEVDEQVVEGHSKHYEAFHDEVRPLPGAADLIRQCRRSGLTVVLATSGSKDDLEWMLPAIGVEEDELDGILTSSDVDESKPAADPFAKALSEHDLDPDRSVAIGDTIWDVEAALRAGVRCIGVTCGGIDRRTLLEAGATEVHDDPRAILGTWEQSLLSSIPAD